MYGIWHENHSANDRNEEYTIKNLAINSHVPVQILAQELGITKNTIDRIIKPHRYETLI